MPASHLWTRQVIDAFVKKFGYDNTVEAIRIMASVPTDNQSVQLTIKRLSDAMAEYPDPHH